MPQVMASTSRSRLHNGTALCAARGTRAPHSKWHDRVTASAVAAVLGTSLLAISGQAVAQDILTPGENIHLNAGEELFLELSGNQQMGALSGVAASRINLGPDSLTTETPLDTTFAGVIRGTGSFIKNGAGTLTLTGENTYTGDTFVNGGFLRIGAGGTTGSIAGNIVNNSFVTFNRSDDVTYSGSISGTGNISKTWSGTLTLNGTSTYSGMTYVIAGTLAVGPNGALSPSSIVQFNNSGTRLDISGSTSGQTVRGLFGGNGTTVWLGSNNLSISGLEPSLYSGIISGSGGINISGGGVFTLAGDNTYSGITTIQHTVLRLGNGGTTGSIAGNIVNNGAIYVNRSDELLYDGVISGTGEVVNSGRGTLTLTGVNTYSGITHASNGTIAIGAGGSISNTSRVYLSTAGTKFDISTSGANQTIGGLAGVAGTEVILGSRNLIIDQSANLTFAGVIDGTAGLIKNGAATLTLSGANTYTGLTTISGGTLALSGDGALNLGANLSLTASSSVFDMSAVNRFNTLGTISGVSGSRILIGDRPLYFGGFGDETFAGSFEGTVISELIKEEPGTATLSGNSSGFAGDMKVLDGHLILTGQMGGMYGGIGDTVRRDWNPSMTVSGSAANWSMLYNLYVRKGGSTALIIENGARVSNKFGAIAYDRETELATVTVTGNGSSWTNREALSVGNNGGNGTVRILDGGTVSSVDGYIGQGSGNGIASQGLVELSGAGSSWVNTDRLRVGDVGGHGNLRILDGASVTTNSALVGSMSGSVGTAIVDGANSIWTINGALDIGSGIGGNGSTTIANGAVVTVGGGTGTANLAPGFGSTGTLNIGAASDMAADAVAAGVLQASRLQFGSFSSSTLRFNHTGTDYEFGAVLASSALGQIKQVSGTTILTSDNAAFLGATSISGGTLIARGKFGGSATVTNGALQFGDASGGAQSTLSTITVSGADSRLSIYGAATLAVTNALNLGDDTVLSIHAGSTTPALTARSIGIGNNVTFNLSGISDEGDLATDLTLFTSDNAISGDFAKVAIGGFSGSVDYISVHTGKSADGLSYVANYGLSWTAANNLAHGTFTLSDATNSFTLGTALSDQTANAATGWNGTRLTKAGAGTLILTGNNTYTGGTTISGGTLQLGDGGTTGSVIGAIANDGVLAINRSGTLTFTNTVSGSGQLEKRGTGTLIVTGTNTYAGGTTIAGGTVSVSQDANLGAASGGVILNGGTLQITGTDFGTLSRDVTIGTIGGAIDVADQAHTLTVASAISGGNLIKRGAGTLALSGTNTHGQTSIEGGTLSGSLANMGTSVSLSDGATLQLNQSGEFAYNGAFSGLGDIVINGDGTTLLTADSAGFTSHTFLNGGTLLVGNAQSAGRLGGSLDVASGATLGGSGIIGSGAGSLVTIGSGAILSPGNSIGTLMINGDLKFENGARYVVEVNPLGTDSDKLIVTGTATLNGGTVAHIGATGTYNPRSTYTIVDAGTLTGAFGSVTSDFAFLNPSLSYDYNAGTVELELVRNDRDFASTAQTRNQIATANAIESIGFAAGHAVYDAVVQLADDTADIRRSFDQLSGELQSSVRSAQIEDSRFVRNAANDRLRAAFGQSVGGDGSALAYAANGAQVAVDATYEGAAFWAQSYGSWGSFDADAGTIELDRHIGGALLGGDVRMSNWRVGVLAGYSQSRVKTERQSATSDNSTLGLYAGSQWGKASLRLALAQSWHDIDTKRSVQMTGLSDYLQADYSATTRQVFVEAGYALISRERNHLEAFANLAQVRARTDAFSETGGAASLNLAKADADVTFTTLGLRGSRQIALGETAGVLRGSAGWRNASGDTSAEGLHAFSAGDAFTVTGAPIAKDAAVIETGMDVRFNARTTFSLTYTGQIADAANDHGFNARLSFSF